MKVGTENGKGLTPWEPAKQKNLNILTRRGVCNL